MIFKRHVLARRLSDFLPLVLLGALGLYSVWPWLPLPRREVRPRTIAFYGFSILGEVMNTRVFAAFEAEWQARTGERVQFVSAFAGSGTVANQIIMGVPAEFASLARTRRAEDREGWRRSGRKLAEAAS